MKVGVFHPGTQHSWQTAHALQQLGKLAWYATSIFYKPGQFPYSLERLLPPPLAKRLHEEFRRFKHDGLDPDLVRTAGLSEWFERLANRLKMHGIARRIDAFGNRRFVRSLAAEVTSREEFALWGYSSSSLSTFKLAKHHGRTCILDRTNGDFEIYNQIMKEVIANYQQWFLPTERQVSSRIIQNDRLEYQFADKILVGSQFSAWTIDQAVGDSAISSKIKILSYCYDEQLFGAVPAPSPVDRSRPVKFLFVGLVIPRKGIQHVLEAIARIPPNAAHLTIVGDLKIPREVFAGYADRVTYIPTVARADVPGIMAAHDVLLLPSYFEGAGIVLYEALASGCGLIQSDRCALAVTEQTGILLDELTTRHVHDAMMAVVDDRDRLDNWRQAAQPAARSYTSGRYRDGIAETLQEIGV